MLLLPDPVTGIMYPHYTRADVGFPPSPAYERPLARRHVIVHHGVGRGNHASVDEAFRIWRAYRNYHMLPKRFGGRGWADIGYSFGWGTAGFTVEGRGWRRDGAHTQNGGNRLGHALCLIGDGRYTDGTEAGWGAVRALVAYGIRIGAVTADPQWSGHLNWWPKDCPGARLYDSIPDNSSLKPKEAPVIPSDCYKFAQAVGQPVYLLNLLDLSREGIETHEARHGIARLFGIEAAVEPVHADVIAQFRPAIDDEVLRLLRQIAQKV